MSAAPGGQPFPPAVEQALGRPFRDLALLRQALTHSSFFEGRGGDTNERLEFLGDRVLGLIAAERLYRQFPHWGENDLAPRLNSIVNRHACAAAARSAELGPALRVSKAEADQGGREKAGILADAAEAVVAAIYLEGGLESARLFIETHWAAAFANAATTERDPKMALQEQAAASGFPPPQYEVVERTGPDHAPVFTVRVHVAGMGHAEGAGGNKRDAERAAASLLLNQAGGA